MSKMRNNEVVEKKDIDLSQYKVEKVPEYISEVDIKKLPEVEKSILLHAGVDLENDKADTFLMKNQTVVHKATRQSGVELLDTNEALAKYPELKKLHWKLIDPNTDKYTKFVYDNPESGYFIRIKKGTKAIFPIQSCLFLETPSVVQNVHNLIILEENSSVEILTGCTSKELGKDGGAHLGITEIYIGKNASLTYSMVHNWHESVRVRSRTAIYVEENGTFISNYVLLKKVKDIQMDPIAYLKGRAARARFNSILLSYPGSFIDVGSRVVLDAPDTSSEIISRVVNKGGKVIARGLISGNVSGVKGHLECQGLILEDGGEIYTIPQLNGLSPDIMLSHEAAVGKIAREEVEYLMARGINETDAVGLIIRGFLYEGLENFPNVLKQEIDRITDELGAKGY
ncbi:MAG: SufD family Fe-S cluster assembly protein [Candidatus Marinimicrobia bacterium]|nr:SufD family Fe-S cluster assembly protein [Candidatus Neomarinimicrobiota bacterium]